MENNVENPVVARAERAGYFVRKVGWIGRKSAPDRVFSRPDRGTVWIEFKDDRKVPTRLQEREHQRMREAGMEVHVCDSVTAALRVLWLD